MKYARILQSTIKYFVCVIKEQKENFGRYSSLQSTIKYFVCVIKKLKKAMDNIVAYNRQLNILFV